MATLNNGEKGLFVWSGTTTPIANTVFNDNSGITTIFEISGATIKSWKSKRSINAFSSFTYGNGYQVSAGSTITLPTQTIGFGNIPSSGGAEISADYLDVVLCVGSTNMLGTEAKTDPRILQLGRGGSSDNKIIGANLPLQTQSIIDSQTIGKGFAKQYAKQTLANGRDVLIISCASADTSFSGNHWNPGNSLFLDAVNRCNALLTAKPNANVVAILIHLGEGDTAMVKTAFASALDAMIAGFRSQILRATYAPAIVGELSPDWIGADTARQAINDAISETPTRLIKTAVADPIGLTTITSNNKLFTASSLETFGTRYHTVLADAIANGPTGGGDPGNGNGGSNGDVSTANALGINIGPPLDFWLDRPLADAMKTSRGWDPISGTTPVPLDANLYPTTNAKTVVWADVPNMHGTYKLKFTGQATLSVDFIGYTIANYNYDSATNTTTADITITTTGVSACQLRFENTTGGVRNIQMMRPLVPGSTSSYAFTDKFTNQFKQAVSRFSVLRTMDFTGTNGNQQVNWSDRAKPTDCTFQYSGEKNGYAFAGRGAPWEYVIAMSNETNKDAWICIPLKASDDYIQQLALLIRDGGNGWSGLNSDRKLYIEYSNEVWNFGPGFSQAQDNVTLAKAEVNAGGSLLNYDNQTNADIVWAWRRIAKRIVEISQIFRDTFGNDQMMSRIRPVLAWQQNVGQGTAFFQLSFLDDVYNNQAGNFVPNPHPVNYYLYGGGGSGYYNPDNGDPNLTIDSFWTSQTMDTDNWIDPQSNDAYWCSAYDLKKVAYEGGTSFDKSNNAADSVKRQALLDPRLRTAFVDHHNVWSNLAGDLLCYYTLSGTPNDFQWIFSPDVFADLNTQKLLAMDDLNAATRSPLTIGASLPAQIPGAFWGATNRGFGDRAPTGLQPIAAGYWYSYHFRVTSAASCSIVLRLNSYQPGTLRVYLGNQQLSDIPFIGDNGANVVTNPIVVSATPGKLYAIRVKCLSGAFDLTRVDIT